MVQTKSNPHLLEEQLYGTADKAKLRIESKGKQKEKRPASMFNPEISSNQEPDYGPLIIDSVVQPIKKREEQPQGGIIVIDLYRNFLMLK